VADVLELIEANFPQLSADEAQTQRHYSRRLNQWRLPQNSEYFTDNFAEHAAAQKAGDMLATGCVLGAL
jgi:hypothetical protein